MNYYNVYLARVFNFLQEKIYVLQVKSCNASNCSQENKFSCKSEYLASFSYLAKYSLLQGIFLILQEKSRIASNILQDLKKNLQEQVFCTLQETCKILALARESCKRLIVILQEKTWLSRGPTLQVTRFFLQDSCKILALARFFFCRCTAGPGRRLAKLQPLS